MVGASGSDVASDDGVGDRRIAVYPTTLARVPRLAEGSVGCNGAVSQRHDRGVVRKDHAGGVIRGYRANVDTTTPAAYDKVGRGRA